MLMGTAGNESNINICCNTLHGHAQKAVQGTLYTEAKAACKHAVLPFISLHDIVQYSSLPLPS